MIKRYAVGVPEDCMRIKVDGLVIAVAREGRGPPVICLSAIGHGAGDFEPLVERMRGWAEIIRLDWPGHGRSTEDHQALSPERYASLLAAVLQQLKVDRPVIIGNSIGGAVAILYARDHPVRGLVLCDPGGLVAVTAPLRWLCNTMAAFFAAGARGAPWFGWAFCLYYRILVLPQSAANPQRARIIAAGSEMSSKLAEAWRGFGRPAADIRSIAWNLDVAVWFAWARSDRVIPLALCRGAIKRMRQAKLSLFRGGHSPFLEDPDAFAKALFDFIESTT